MGSGGDARVAHVTARRAGLAVVALATLIGLWNTLSYPSGAGFDAAVDYKAQPIAEGALMRLQAGAACFQSCCSPYILTSMSPAAGSLGAAARARLI